MMNCVTPRKAISNHALSAMNAWIMVWLYNAYLEDVDVHLILFGMGLIGKTLELFKDLILSFLT